MFHLPIEIQNYIYSYDPSYRDRFNRVVHQLKMRNVWRSCRKRSQERWIVIPSSHYDIDNRVKRMVTFQRVIGSKKRRPFTEDDILDFLIRSFLSHKTAVYSDLFIWL